MPIITATYVKSLNGYEVSGPFTGDGGVILDGSDIHITGGSGETITEEMQDIAQNIQMVEMQPLETEGDFRMRIGDYPLEMST